MIPDYTKRKCSQYRSLEGGDLHDIVYKSEIDLWILGFFITCELVPSDPVPVEERDLWKFMYEDFTVDNLLVEQFFYL